MPCAPALLALALLTQAPTPSPAPPPTVPPAPAAAATVDPILREAQAFMDTYAKDLIAGDREALWRRYDPRGSYWLGAGRKHFATVEEAKERYLKLWNPPQSFAWKDLSFEVVGPGAVVVAGRFEWGRNGTVTPCSYSALLLKREGRWVIRLEDESAAPPPAGH